MTRPAERRLLGGLDWPVAIKRPSDRPLQVAMSRLSIQLALAGLLLLAVFTSFIRALAYDDTGLATIQSTLLPSDCAACFMGIRPGQTPLAEALELLKNHPWVASVKVSAAATQAGSGAVNWTWSVMHPPWLGSLGGLLRIENYRVEQIEVDTLLPFSDVWMLLGEPDKGSLKSVLRVIGRPQLIHYAVYNEVDLWARSETLCPLRPTRFWDAPTKLIWNEDPYRYIQLENYDLRRWFLNQPPCRS
jgi:hypothetical protein